MLAESMKRGEESKLLVQALTTRLQESAEKIEKTKAKVKVMQLLGAVTDCTVLLHALSSCVLWRRS